MSWGEEIKEKKVDGAADTKSPCEAGNNSPLCLLSATVLGLFPHVPAHFILRTPLGVGFINPHFKEKEMGAQEGQLPCP